MSWSVNFIGTPEKVVTALDEYAARMGEGQSKNEYLGALPHLKGIVSQNYANNALVDLSAHGSGTTSNGEEIQRSCSATIQLRYGVLS
jgi:hypothetical protein